MFVHVIVVRVPLIAKKERINSRDIIEFGI